jgi:membrane associated rhomboid family serine protease
LIPLKDDNPTRTFPFVTIAVILANVGVFVRVLMLPGPAQQSLVLRLALIPSELTHAPPGRYDLIGYNLLTILTSMFVHGGWIHLLGNMLYLWIFGNNIEDVVGHARFALFYLLCGLTGALAQIAIDPSSTVPMIGASGAIAGVLGAYLVTFPAARIHTLVFFVIFARVAEVPALIVLGFWLLIQLVNASRVGPGGVAWFAHLGGFLAGLLLIALLRKRRVRHSLY